ncbi:MAG: substrate-binding domain-containing protein [Eubacteriales bacterium]|jgi:ribose transport system substrate-binding protein
MKAKSILAGLVAAACAVSMTACGSTSSTSTTTSSSSSTSSASVSSSSATSETSSTSSSTDETVTASSTESVETVSSSSSSEAVALNTTDGLIGISVPSADHGWTAGVAYYAEQKCEELGLEEGTGYTLLTADSVNDQANDLDELINMGCTSIVLDPQNNEVSVAAQKVLDAGINLIVFDRKIDGDYTAYLAGDNAGIGTNAAKYLGEALGGEGTIAVMSAPSVGSVSVERTEAFTEYMTENYPDIELVEVTAEGFTQEAGLTMATDMLTAYDQIDAVFSIDDEPSLGILQAVKEAGRTDVKYISGGGGAQSWYQKIQTEEDITLFTETYSPSMIGDAIELAQQIQQGEDFEKETILPNETVDASNVADYIDEDSPY